MNRAETIFTTDRRDNEIHIKRTALPPHYTPPHTKEDDPLHVTFERMRSVINQETN